MTTPLPQFVASPFVKKLTNILDSCNTLEEIVARLLWKPIKIRLGAFGHAEEGMLSAIVHVEPGTRDCPTGDLLWFGLPLAALKKQYRYRPLNENTYDFADQAGYLTDEEWFRARNERLRIRWDQWNEGKFVAPPTALAELILSYALSNVGFVQLSRTMEEFDSYPWTSWALRIELVHIQPTSERGWEETIFMRYRKLEALVERRSKRRLSCSDLHLI